MIKIYDKIYEQIKEENRQQSAKFMKTLGIIESVDEIKNTIPKKNYDLAILLEGLDLIEVDDEKQEIINGFHDYLIKLGIETGVFNSRQLLIDGLQNDKITFEELMDLNPEECIKSIATPAFIGELMEALE